MRPTEYKEEYIEEAVAYLKEHQDEEEEFVKQRNEEKGYEILDHKLKVKLPTIEGFALRLGVSKKSLYNWAEKHEDFLHSLEKIKQEQQKRLINSGLSGDYNPTIAKLILSSNHGMREKSETDITSGGKPIYNGKST